jgi:biotin carboxyl carrier protein
MKFDLLIDGRENKVELSIGKLVSVNVNGEVFEVEVVKNNKGAVVRLDDREYNMGFEAPRLSIDGQMHEVEVRNLRRGRPSWNYDSGRAEESEKGRPVRRTSGSEGMILPPMPGRVVSVKVKEGQSVKAGDPVLVLEAMKMQNEIVANTDGIVREVRVSVGDLVETEDILVMIGH